MKVVEKELRDLTVEHELLLQAFEKVSHITGFTFCSALQVFIRASPCPAGSAGARRAAEAADRGHPGRAAEEWPEGAAAGEEAGSAD